MKVSSSFSRTSISVPHRTRWELKTESCVFQWMQQQYPCFHFPLIFWNRNFRKTCHSLCQRAACSCLPAPSKNPFPEVSSPSPWSDITSLTQGLISFTTQVLNSLCPGCAPHLALIHDLEYTWGCVSPAVSSAPWIWSLWCTGSHSLLATWVPWTSVLKLMHFGFWGKAN